MPCTHGQEGIEGLPGARALLQLGGAGAEVGVGERGDLGSMELTRATVSAYLFLAASPSSPPAPPNMPPSRPPARRARRRGPHHRRRGAGGSVARAGGGAAGATERTRGRERRRRRRRGGGRGRRWVGEAQGSGAGRGGGRRHGHRRGGVARCFVWPSGARRAWPQAEEEEQWLRVVRARWRWGKEKDKEIGPSELGWACAFVVGRTRAGLLYMTNLRLGRSRLAVGPSGSHVPLFFCRV